MNQPNDIAITAKGMLFVSDPDGSGGTGTRWRIDPDGGVSVREADMGMTNGVEVSPEERRLWINQTVQRNAWAYDRSPRRTFSTKWLVIQFDDGLEGMRCDVVGTLQVTRWGKGTVVKLAPTGELLHEIALGGKRCTNLTFGGPGGRTCDVTVADAGDDERFRVDLRGRCWDPWQWP